MKRCEKKDWIYHPIATLHPLHDKIAEILSHIREQDISAGQVDPIDCHIYFTDGSCLDPKHFSIRRSAWAVVRQFFQSSSHPEGDIDVCQAMDFSCIAAGFTHGQQTINRAELIAILKACQSAMQDPACVKVIIHTDSQYAISILRSLRKSTNRQWLYKTVNADLVKSLDEINKNIEVELIKVKSHRELADADTMEEARIIMGNDLADKSAGAAVRRIPKEVQSLINEIRDYMNSEFECLKIVLDYIVQFNHARCEALPNYQPLISNRSASSQDTPQFAMGEDAYRLLCQYDMTDAKSFPDIMPEEVELKGCL